MKRVSVLLVVAFFFVFFVTASAEESKPDLPRPVLGTIVDEDDLHVVVVRRCHFVNFLVKLDETFFFVVNRNDDGELHKKDNPIDYERVSTVFIELARKRQLGRCGCPGRPDGAQRL